MFRLLFSDMKKNYKLFLGTFFAIFVATIIVTACLNLVFSATANFSNGNRFDNVDFILIPNQNIFLETIEDDGDIDIDKEKVEGRIVFTENQLHKLKSHYTIIEDYTFNIKLKNLKTNTVAGHNYSSIGFSEFNVNGNEPNDNQVLIDENVASVNNLKIGDTITVQTNNKSSKFEISGIVTSYGKENFSIQNYVFFSDKIAKENSLGCYSVAILDKNVNIADFDENEFTIFTGTETNNAELPWIISNDISLMVIFITMGSVCLVISLFVISGAMQFSIKNRFRLLTQLRVIGLKKSKIIAILVIQTFILSLFATSLALLLSDSLANFIATMYLTMGILGDNFTVTFSFLWSLVVLGGFILLSIIIAIISSAKPLSLPPASAIKSEGEVLGKTSIVGIIFGIILILGGIAILIFTPMTQGIGIGMGFCATSLFLIGAILLTPIIIKFFNILFSIITKRFSKSLGSVAYGNIKLKASKFAVASVSIAIMMSMGTVMLLNNETYVKSLANTQYKVSNNFDYISENLFEYEIPTNQSFMATKITEVLIQKGDKLGNYTALSVLGQIPNVDILQGSRSINGNSVLLSEDFKNIKIGDKIELYLENGIKKDFIVSGFFSSEGISDENYSFIVDFDYIKDSLYNQRFPIVYSNKAIFDNSIKNNLEYYKNTPSFNIQSAASLLLGFIGITLSVVALFNTFFVIMSVRKKEFHGLKVIGAKKYQIFKMTFLEVLIVTLTGMFIGLAVLIATVGTYSVENTSIFDFIVNDTIFFGMIIITSILGLLSGVIPSVFTVKRLKRQFRDDG